MATIGAGGSGRDIDGGGWWLDFKTEKNTKTMLEYVRWRDGCYWRLLEWRLVLVASHHVVISATVDAAADAVGIGIIFVVTFLSLGIFGGSDYPLRMLGACEPAANTRRDVSRETVVLVSFRFVLLFTNSHIHPCKACAQSNGLKSTRMQDMNTQQYIKRI